MLYPFRRDSRKRSTYATTANYGRFRLLQSKPKALQAQKPYTVKALNINVTMIPMAKAIVSSMFIFVIIPTILISVKPNSLAAGDC